MGYIFTNRGWVFSPFVAGVAVLPPNTTVYTVPGPRPPNAPAVGNASLVPLSGTAIMNVAFGTVLDVDSNQNIVTNYKVDPYALGRNLNSQDWDLLVDVVDTGLTYVTKVLNTSAATGTNTSQKVGVDVGTSTPTNGYTLELAPDPLRDTTWTMTRGSTQGSSTDTPAVSPFRIYREIGQTKYYWTAGRSVGGTAFVTLETAAQKDLGTQMWIVLYPANL